MRLGDLTPAAYRLGDSAASAVYAGDTKVWPSFTPSGMTKSGTFTPTTSYSTVTGWNSNAGSTVIDNALVVIGGGIVTVESSARLMNASFSAARTAQLRLMLNGTTELANSGTISVPPADGTYTLNATGVTVSDGDRISMQALMSSFGQITLVQDVGSFLRVVQ